MTTLSLKLTAIAFLVISSSFIGSSVIAETEPEESADSLLKPITNTEVFETTVTSEAQLEASPDFSQEPALTISTPKRSQFEVHPRGERWQHRNTGDSDKGKFTVNFPLRR